ncbi:uncharacterized protein LOC143637122 [Bidens hawaiensis]|uniref:uncharacterized protein LOC143637122 n=1 Tax=Bidens hawaiensis TaxID=980011 RepID=UPI00404B1409
MAASKLASLAAAAAAAASTTTHAYADGPSYRFNPFSPSPSPPQPAQPESNAEPKPEVEDSKGGFDPEALERGAKALRDINSSPLSKQVFELMRKQEQARLTELAAEKAHQEAIQAQLDIERQRKLAEEQMNLLQQQSNAKAQLLRYEDELARKRMQVQLVICGFYETDDDTKKLKWHSLFAKKTQKIVVKDLPDDVIREAAKKTEGFSGREIAKLVASVQAAVYGRPDCTLDSQLLMEIVDYKVAEHHQRIQLANAGSQLA